MPRTRIKICGITTVDTALTAVESGADAIGFVFARSSPRFIEPENAWEIAMYLPPMVTKVGLFVDVAPEEFLRVKESCPFDYGQLHGLEDETCVRQCGPWLIKAIQFDPTSIESELRRWNAVDELDAILVDGSIGGQGVAMDWNALAAVQGLSHHPIILAGGLTPDNVGDAIRTVRPYAVDVSSGVESTQGVKDARLIARFCEAVRQAYSNL